MIKLKHESKIMYLWLMNENEPIDNETHKIINYYKNKKYKLHTLISGTGNIENTLKQIVHNNI